MRDTGGDCTAWITAARSRSRPCFQALPRIVESRICSRLWTGSAWMPTSASNAVAVALTRSRSNSGSSAMAAPGAANDFIMETGSPAVLPGSVNRKVGRRLQPPDAVRVLPPGRQSVFPQFRLFAGVLLRGDSLAPCVVLVDPGEELLRGQFREGQQQVGDVALGVDHQRGDSIDRGLLQQRQAQTGLSAARHAEAHGVSNQIPGIVKQGTVPGFSGSGIERPAQVESAQLLVIWQ